MDQNHEQLNASTQDVGAAIGLTKNDIPLQRWLITGPEVASLLKEFETLHTANQEPALEHHDTSASAAKQFLSAVKMYLGAMDDLCNLFLDENFDLYSLDTMVAIELNVTTGFKHMKDTGKKQLIEFIETLLL